MFQYLMILLFIITNCESGCIYAYKKPQTKCDSEKCTNEDYYVQCDTINDAKNAEDQTNWSQLHVKSFGKQETVGADFLAKIPNVTRLIFENSVNDIQGYSFPKGPLKYLKFSACNLPVIKKNWFSNSSVAELEISESNVHSLEERSFDGLRKLTLKGNNFTRINTNVFNESLIEDLRLENNQISFIDENALANMTKLYKISLNRNFLTTFNSKLIAGQQNNSNLERLYLQYNQIKYLNEDSFAAFPNIKIIDLSSNELDLIDDRTFDALYKLEFLDLAFNKLKSFPERALPYNGLPSLEYLQLHRNLLSYLPIHFIRNFPKLEGISIFGNPWQCSCYKEMMNTFSVHHKNVKIRCSEEYLNGERPICFIPETNNGKCVENTQNEDDFGKSFVEVSDVYPDETLFKC